MMRRAMVKVGFHPNGVRAALAVFGLAATLAANVAHGLLYSHLRSNWKQIDDPEPLVRLETAVGHALLASAVLGGIAFLFWFRRAYGNAHALGLQGRHGLGWAVGGWFVPFLNLVRPGQIAIEMWAHAGRDRVGGTSTVAIWWMAFLIGNFSSSIGARLIASESEPMTLLGLEILLASDAVTVLAAILAIVIVRRLTAAHATMAGAPHHASFA